MAHGSGLKFDVDASRSESYRGAYGRICPTLKKWVPEGVPEMGFDKYFLDIADRRMIEAPDVLSGTIASDDQLRDNLEKKFGSAIPAGYTYFGQFIDHDITFDPMSSLMRRNDPSRIHNFRTPRLDLDSLYGRGPEDQPYLYEKGRKQEGEMLVGEVDGSKFRDLPRNSQGRALIGDPRNDENAIVSQLHLAFLLAHNSLVQRAKDMADPDPFETARRTLRWLYQYIVWNDFLKRVTIKEVHQRALQRVDAGGGKMMWTLGFDQLYDWDRQPFMPVEFSAAAYRFGHSMVRNEYQTNELRGIGKFVPLFDRADADDLRGRQPLSKNNVIQWSWFLKMGLPRARQKFPQMARKIDTKLSNALACMPAEVKPRNVLAYLNLKRGWAFELPAGTAVAQSFEKYGIKRAPLEPGEPDALWYYILREAELVSDSDAGNKLGPLGSAIVCATFASLLKSDPDSYVNSDPTWKPNDAPLLCPGLDNADGEVASGQDPDRDRSWTLASIIRISGLPIDGQDIDDQSVGRFRSTKCPR
jgi:hypothetical protein